MVCASVIIESQVRRGGRDGRMERIERRRDGSMTE
jgi:hypothetical protein